jgi:predicted amidohydrolase
LRAAAVQLNSTDDKERNLRRAGALVRDAASDGAELVVLPEKFNLLGDGAALKAGAEPLDGATLRWSAEVAHSLGIWLVAGSVVERVAGDEKLRNTATLISPSGTIAAVYRKIHMFDVDVGGIAYRESDTEAPGEDIVTADAGGVELGLAICYDLRFPEVFRILALRGARVIALPAAFTVPTGRAHWEVLVRARAIENQAFVVAAGQVGQHPPHHQSYGHSLIVDPWGVVLAAAGEDECFIVADLDFDALEELREKLPSLANRRPSAYRWPAAPTEKSRPRAGVA